jgi:subtilase family serine protease
MTQFNTEAMQLAGMGVTVFASSGDDGVSNYDCACTTNSGSSTLTWEVSLN